MGVTGLEPRGSESTGNLFCFGRRVNAVAPPPCSSAAPALVASPPPRFPHHAQLGGGLAVVQRILRLAGSSSTISRVPWATRYSGS